MPFLCIHMGQKFHLGDFRGGPVVKTSPSNAGGVSSIPGWGAKTPRASWPKKQNTKQNQCCNRSNKDFKNGSDQCYVYLNIHFFFKKEISTGPVWPDIIPNSVSVGVWSIWTILDLVRRSPCPEVHALDSPTWALSGSMGMCPPGSLPPHCAPSSPEVSPPTAPASVLRPSQVFPRVQVPRSPGSDHSCESRTSPLPLPGKHVTRTCSLSLLQKSERSPCFRSGPMDCPLTPPRVSFTPLWHPSPEH